MGDKYVHRQAKHFVGFYLRQSVALESSAFFIRHADGNSMLLLPATRLPRFVETKAMAISAVFNQGSKTTREPRRGTHVPLGFWSLFMPQMAMEKTKTEEQPSSDSRTDQRNTRLRFWRPSGMCYKRKASKLAHLCVRPSTFHLSLPSVSCISTVPAFSIYYFLLVLLHPPQPATHGTNSTSRPSLVSHPRSMLLAVTGQRPSIDHRYCHHFIYIYSMKYFDGLRVLPLRPLTV